MDETKRLLAEYLRQVRPDLTEVPQATLETRPLRDLLDSISMLAFLCFLEAQFSLTLQDAEIAPEDFATITTVSFFIEKKRGLPSV